MSSHPIRTFTGRMVDPAALSVDDIDVRDIAHALARQCRFSGHVATDGIYSVAEHSVRAAWLVPASDDPWPRILTLLHDASEAYLVDIPRPMKHRPEFAWYREREAAAMGVIHWALLGLRSAISNDYAAMIQLADEVVLNAEQRDLLPWSDHNEELASRHPGRMECWTPRKAERVFLREYAKMHPHPTRLPEELRAVGNGRMTSGEFREWRLSRGLSQSQAAKLLEVSPAFVSHMERGRAEVPARVAAKIHET